jgi:hypothetical protein
MPVRTSHACTGPSALLAPSTTSSRKSDTAAIAGAERGGARLENVQREASAQPVFHQKLSRVSFFLGREPRSSNSRTLEKKIRRDLRKKSSSSLV